MTANRSFPFLGVLAVATLTASACTNSSGGLPTTPSSVAGPVRGAVAGSDDGELEGIVSEVVSGCAAGLSFRVRGILVTTSSSTVFHDAVCEEIAPGVDVEVQGSLQPDGRFAAASIEIERHDRAREEDDEADDEGDEGDGELEGIVDLVVSDCSAGLSFMVEGTLVTTTSATIFDETACEEIVPGADVEVEGTRQPDGSLAAASIEIERHSDEEEEDNESDNEEGEGDDEDGELEGIVDLIVSDCTAGLSFMVEGILVTTTSSTDFDEGACEEVVPGVDVEVQGARQPDGSFAAASVEIEHHDDAAEEEDDSDDEGDDEGDSEDGEDDGEDNDEDDEEDDDEDEGDGDEEDDEEEGHEGHDN